jgi:UDPglucose 6-dehydrogenase
VLEELYQPFGAPLIVTDINSAEIIKHASNSFLALKISYINSVANICELAGANVEQVARGMGLDKRIGPGSLHAGIGYGGSCFPKDVDAFYDISKELGYEFTLIKMAQQINADQRRRFIQKIERALWVVKGKQVAILGLSFKPDTDDMRDAPSLDIIGWLLENGATVRAYDPESMDKAREMLPEVEYAGDAYQAAAGADALVLVTEWAEFEQLDPHKLVETMRQPILIDGRNLFEPDAMRDAGFEYVSVGR